jgi:hypothetical protein
MNMFVSIEEVAYVFLANRNISAALFVRSFIRRSTNFPMSSCLLFR